MFDNIIIMDELIEEAYEETNYGQIEKIYKYLNIHHKEAEITRSDIKTYLANQEQEQLLKQTKTKSNFGHIVASYPNELVQIDIYDLSKYHTYNKNYKYIFAMVDVFTRIAYALPMKTKTIEDTTNTLQMIIKKSGIPTIIMSDNDSSFLGDKFREFLDDNNIILDTNIKDDHFALGIIDNFAKRLKLIFAKKFLKYKTKNWIQYLNEIIKSYNNSSHSSLDGLTPNEASEDKNYDQIYRLNYIKGLKNKTISDLKVGDKVRIKIAGKFTKSSEPQFSDQVYEVKTIKGQTIHLTNGESKKRYNLLKVPKDAITIQNNIINQVNQKARQKRKLKQEGLI
jgi:hypothetical protein